MGWLKLYNNIVLRLLRVANRARFGPAQQRRLVARKPTCLAGWCLPDHEDGGYMTHRRPGRLSGRLDAQPLLRSGGGRSG